MKRWAWLGLVGLLAACKEEEPIIPEPPAPAECADPSASALTPPPVAASSLALRLAPQEWGPTGLDGRHPVIIRYRRAPAAASTAASLASAAVRRAGGSVTASWARLDAVAARLSPQERAELAQNPDVLSIELDRTVRAFARTAPITSGAVDEYTPGLKLVQASDVWDANSDGSLDANAPIGSGIKVCVIDSGWDNRHPELQATYVGGKDFVDGDDDPLDFDVNTETWGGGHGTHTAATIVAQLASTGDVNPSDYPHGMVGVAPGVELLVARVLNTEGSGSTSNIISALQWCQAQGARIASLSLGAPDPSPAEQAAFDKALADGMLPVAATGNSGDTVTGVAYPAGYSSVLAVGAVDFDSKHPSFSQTGPQVALVAPGVDVLSAVVRGSESYSLIEVEGQAFESRSLAFAPHGEFTGKLLNCGLGNSSSSCGSSVPPEGFVAYVDRGGVDSEGNGLTFAKKVAFTREAGARAVIIGNNNPDEGVGNFTLGDPGDWVPTASISFASATTLKAQIGKDARVGLIGTDYARLTGTSMATPHVSGVAALVWGARPALTPEQVRKLLVDSSKDLGPECRDSRFGFGLVQAKAALELLDRRFPASP